MDEIDYLKCSCKECGVHIEYPAHAAGTTVACPHCGQWTELDSLPETPEPRNYNLLIIAMAAIVLLGVGIAAWKYFGKVPSVKTTIASNSPTLDKTTVPIAASPVAEVITQAIARTPAVPKPKSAADFKISEVKLEKTPGNSLVYAVGAILNDSEWQRFGLKVEVDLINVHGKTIGKAQDQKSIIEPHQEWHFHALIPNPDTVAVKLRSLTEGE